jgi:hypothetical protein
MQSVENTAKDGPKRIGRINRVAVLTGYPYKKMYYFLGVFRVQKSGRNVEMTVLTEWL